MNLKFHSNNIERLTNQEVRINYQKSKASLYIYTRSYRTMRVTFTLLCFLLCGTFVVAQDSIAVLSINLLEDLLESDEDANYDFFALYDELQVYLKNPLNINTASEEDLEGLQMLSDIQIADIISYRDDYGPFLSKYELQSIPSLDVGVLRSLVPLVTDGGELKNHTFKSIMEESRSTLFIKGKRVLQERKGFTDDSYLGDPNHLFARYNFISGRNVRAGLTMEKDPGEQFFSGSNTTGFDYYTGFIHLKDLLPRVKNLNIGDYSVSMGQGLIVHNSFGGGKSSFVTNIKKGGRAIRPYSSVTEANFFRGLAATVDVSDHIEVTAFGSNRDFDATIFADTTIDVGFQRISSIVVDGFHRTENEINKKGAGNQTSAGGILKFKNKSFKVAFNALHQRFSIPLSNTDDLYRKFRFSGDQLTNLSLDYSYRYKNFNLFGEAARSDNGGTAFLSGALITLGRNIDMAIAFRDYARDYQVLNANAFSESTLPVNERGTYISLLVRPTRQLTFSAYYDIWTHPWLRFQKDAPSEGREILLKAEYNEKRKFNIYLQYRYEEKEQNGQDLLGGIDPLITRGQHRARLNITSTLNKSLKLRNRLEYTHFNEDGNHSDGYLIYQDIIYKPLGKSYSITARYALFDTDGFDTRIYTYENDILYEFSIPFYADRGSRFYINWRQRLGRKITIEGRYSRTYYDNRETIGSGGQLINGNVRSEIKAQIKYRF